ncbi:SRPBCC domain-containing protein [Sinomonas sp. JGH33]|uniref:SRPBCC domain-containing protein n=1 Tax=Sinomonas terricola TaxID=3110330 RepID=A0ABU5T5S6_9MICC|nr:SRPBCC domain-containing protein [Sinomonas sp. JGH33]MEA5455014.1 SRPBCC domain-containing protein [Sinomonas sp. JGH33]
MTNIVRDAVASTTVAATRESVWEALTTPEQIKKYLFGSDVQSTWEVGGPITFAGEWQGKQYQDHGVILDAEPPGLLRISHYSPLSGKPDIPENYHTVEYRIEQEGDASKVTITQGNNSNEAEVTESEKTWQLVLANLKDLLETE